MAVQLTVPALIADAAWRYIDFFIATIRSANTRRGLHAGMRALLRLLRRSAITALGRPGSRPILANGGALEHAQAMAGHESTRRTKLYDRTQERLIQDEVECIRL